MKMNLIRTVGPLAAGSLLALTPFVLPAQTSTTYVTVPANGTAPAYAATPAPGPVVLPATSVSTETQSDTSSPSTSQKLIDNANNIQRRLLRNPATAHEPVYIRPENDQITLTGTVSSASAKERIEGIANDASITSRVVSRLKVVH